MSLGYGLIGFCRDFLVEPNGRFETIFTEDWHERLQPELCQKLGVTRLPPVAPEVEFSLDVLERK